MKKMNKYWQYAEFSERNYMQKMIIYNPILCMYHEIRLHKTGFIKVQIYQNNKNQEEL
jgi:hypothetical protein